jgi:LuxR family maltose regulon positive regulatory protein
MHLVIATRSDPFFLPLSRRRARGQMIEIRADDLRFLSQETTTFLNQVMGLGLSGDPVATLENRTEGWIAGLHLAALSMQGRKQSGEDSISFISAFSGDDRYIGDYLVDAVLARRPQGTRDFMLQTSILDRMTGSLCDAVTGQAGGKQVLQELEQANLFIVPLDHRRHWDRYQGIQYTRCACSSDGRDLARDHSCARGKFYSNTGCHTGPDASSRVVSLT